MNHIANERGDQSEVRTVSELHRRFRDAGVRRACVVVRSGEYRLFADRVVPGAPPLLPVLLRYLPRPDQWEHQAVFIGRPSEAHPEIDLLFFAFVHDTRRGLAQGGLRLRDYEDVGELEKLFEDGLRLSQGMTMKNATADLWWGGGKGIIAQMPNVGPKIRKPHGTAYPAHRADLFQEYGRFVSEIGGIYYTAADLNTDNDDMLHVLSSTRFVTCIPEHAGGSADPSPLTARGVARSISAAWKELSGTESLAGVRVAVQGAGKVGLPLVLDLVESGAHVRVGDTAADALRRVEQAAAQARHEGRQVHTGHLEYVLLADDPNSILASEVDVISPCATGQTINSESIARFTGSVKLVCGAANNMLRDEDRDAALLQDRGICYVPDFISNRMGIVNCADEWMGFLADDSWTAVDRLVDDVAMIVSQWKSRGTSTLQIAREMAQARLAVPHPLERLRGRAGRLLDRYLSRLHEIQ